MNSECREDAQSDDGKFVAARRVDGSPFFLLPVLNLRVEEKIVYLEPIIVYF